MEIQPRELGRRLAPRHGGSAGASDTGCSCSAYRAGEVGHGPKTLGHGRRGSSPDVPQLRAFLGGTSHLMETGARAPIRSQMAPASGAGGRAGEPWQAGTPRAPLRARNRVRKPQAVQRARFWEKPDKRCHPVVHKGNRSALLDATGTSPDAWGLGPRHWQRPPGSPPAWQPARRPLRLQPPGTDSKNIVSEYKFLPLSGFPMPCSSFPPLHLCVL